MPISRRHFLAAGSALPGLAASGSASASASAASAAAASLQSGGGQPPNILLILADDLAAWMLGCYGNQEIKTPNIDNLARRGVKFQHNFVCTPICSASRATLFTGRTPGQHGIHDFLSDSPIDNPPQGQKAPPASFANETMISDVLSARGYATGYVGKWHMGRDTEPGHGIQWWYTMNGGSRSYSDPEMSLNGKMVKETGYLAELMTNRAVEFIEKQSAAKPFFLTASYLNPHTPYDGHPQKYYDLYARTSFDTLGWEPPAPHALREKNLLKDTVANIRKCAASVTALDDQVGVLLKKLDQKGLYDNTLIVFTGDNGYLLGRHGLWSKGLASDPINMYEEVMATPMLVSWRGRIPVESSRPELVSFYDMMPTLCDAAGAETPSGKNLCGRSFLPLALRKPLPKDKPWRSTVFGQFRNTFMARDNRFKVVRRNNGQGPNELFDLRSDPREKVNQYANPQFVTVKERLERDLLAWQKQYAG